jgi:hypothetical protein
MLLSHHVALFDLHASRDRTDVGYSSGWLMACQMKVFVS